MKKTKKQKGVIACKSEGGRWVVVSVSVGDVKCYIYRSNDGCVECLNNTPLHSPPGRIGPYLPNGAPDLSDYAIHWSYSLPHDIIFLLPKGVYLNFPNLHGFFFLFLFHSPLFSRNLQTVWVTFGTFHLFHHYK